MSDYTLPSTSDLKQTIDTIVASTSGSDYASVILYEKDAQAPDWVKLVYKMCDEWLNAKTGTGIAATYPEATVLQSLKTSAQKFNPSVPDSSFVTNVSCAQSGVSTTSGWTSHFSNGILSGIPLDDLLTFRFTNGGNTANIESYTKATGQIACMLMDQNLLACDTGDRIGSTMATALVQLGGGALDTPTQTFSGLWYVITQSAAELIKNNRYSLAQLLPLASDGPSSITIEPFSTALGKYTYSETSFKTCVDSLWSLASQPSFANLSSPTLDELTDFSKQDLRTLDTNAPTCLPALYTYCNNWATTHGSKESLDTRYSDPQNLLITYYSGSPVMNTSACSTAHITCADSLIPDTEKWGNFLTTDCKFKSNTYEFMQKRFNAPGNTAHIDTYTKAAAQIACFLAENTPFSVNGHSIKDIIAKSIPKLGGENLITPHQTFSGLWFVLAHAMSTIKFNAYTFDNVLHI
jgi:hypothetical protein